MVKEKAYLLYTDNEQTRLLAMAYSEEQLLEETQYYSEGVWFVCDHINNRFLENEKKYKKKVVFPETPSIRPSYRETKENYKWIGK